MKKYLLAAVAVFGFVGPAVAQVPATQIAGNPVAPRIWPTNPSWVLIVGNNGWIAQDSDGGGAEAGGVGGFADFRFPNTGDPRTDIWVYDGSTDDSIGINALCVPGCKAGQGWFDGATTIFLPFSDKQRGQPGSITNPGVYKIVITTVAGFGTFFEAEPIATNPGGGGSSPLGGGAPSAVTFNPTDGRLYVVNAANGNLETVDNPFGFNNQTTGLLPQTIRTVGTTDKGRDAHAVTYAPSDKVYVGTTDGLDLFSNVSNCGPPASNCNPTPLTLTLVGAGAPQVLQRGYGVSGISYHGGYLYLLVNSIGAVVRYNPATEVTQLVKPGFTFPRDIPTAINFDDVGNLYVGSNPNEGINQNGSMFRMLATDIAALPPV